MKSERSRVLRLVFGNQLFPLRESAMAPGSIVFMAEDMGLCTDFRHHQQKIVLFLAAMRCYRDSLEAAGHTVCYTELDADDASPYEEKMLSVVRRTGATVLEFFEIEDRPMERRIEAFAAEHGLEVRQLVSPMFLTGRDEFKRFVAGRDRVRMAEFYKAQRSRLGILVDASGKPAGGKWSYDELNRKKLPRGLETPPRPPVPENPVVSEVIDQVAATFGDHPGRAAGFRWPVTRDDALAWLRSFVETRLGQFGPYEDAVSARSPTVYHSLLSPMMNLGLLTPREILEHVANAASDTDIPLQSLEGFYRQVIGWREFVRGVYRHFGERQESANFWRHERELTKEWYTGETGIPILDDTINNVLRDGWTHHIPRLMVVANLMTLCGIRPSAAHHWFMELFVDASEWVMGPNVYGMGLFSDGGIMVTKPYICGSNYLRKMSDYPRGEWCDTVDGLYWRFIDRHRDYFSSNPRLSLMVGALHRLAEPRRRRIFAAADEFIERVSHRSSG